MNGKIRYLIHRLGLPAANIQLNKPNIAWLHLTMIASYLMLTWGIFFIIRSNVLIEPLSYTSFSEFDVQNMLSNYDRQSNHYDRLGAFYPAVQGAFYPTSYFFEKKLCPYGIMTRFHVYTVWSLSTGFTVHISEITMISCKTTAS